MSATRRKTSPPQIVGEAKTIVPSWFFETCSNPFGRGPASQGVAAENDQSRQTCGLQGFADECGPGRGDGFGLSGPYWI